MQNYKVASIKANKGKKQLYKFTEKNIESYEYFFDNLLRK